MIMAYILIYLILPLFFFTKKYALFILSVLLLAIIFGSIITFMRSRVGVPPVNKFEVIWPFINFQIPATAATIVIFKRWYLFSLRLEEERHELEYEKLDAELNFLKSQIHPHFLFNTLNNLYALTLKKSDKASEVVIQLSNLLHHMLYSSKATTVSLESEIERLKEYIHLEEMNYGRRLELNMDVTGDIKEKEISPLIMHAFVENSFKHGVSNDTKSPLINIKIDVQGTKLYFKIQNSFNPEYNEEGSYTEGIGLNNVKRRLELLYPGKYQLEITSDNGIFQVLLDIDLSGSSLIKNIKIR